MKLLCKTLSIPFSFVLILLVASVTCAESVTQVDKLFNYAEGLFLFREYGAAREIYLKVICLYPNNRYQDDAQFKIGESFAREGSFWYAIDEWQRLIDKYPASKLVDKATKNIGMAKIMVQDKEKPILTTEDRVADKYIHFGDDFLRNSVRWSDYGIIYTKEKLEKALYWFDKVISEFPQSYLSAKAQYYKGETYSKQGYNREYFRGESFVEFSWPKVAEDYKKSVQEYQKVIDNYPGTYWADRAGVKIGDIYIERLNNKEASIKAYKKVMEKNKMDFNNYYACYSSAQINYIESKEIEKHTKYASVFITRREPGYRTAEDKTVHKYIEYGKFFLDRSVQEGTVGIVYNQEELDTAFYWFDKVIKEYPESYLAAKAQYYKAETYLKQKRKVNYKKAIEEYQKATDNYPGTYWADEAGIKIGDIYKDMADRKKSIEAYQRVVDRKGGDINNYYVSYAQTQINYLK
jgi:TolA-binding protein